jgi:Ca2+/Na+ antiporter
MPFGPVHGALHEGGAAHAAAAVTLSTANPIISTVLGIATSSPFTTTALTETSTGFPHWNIGTVLGLILLAIIFALTYHFTLFCFQFLHRL